MANRWPKGSQSPSKTMNKKIKVIKKADIKPASPEVPKPEAPKPAARGVAEWVRQYREDKARTTAQAFQLLMEVRDNAIL